MYARPEPRVPGSLFRGLGGGLHYLESSLGGFGTAPVRDNGGLSLAPGASSAWPLRGDPPGQEAVDKEEAIGHGAQQRPYLGKERVEIIPGRHCQ